MATFLAHFLHNAQTEQDIQNSVSAAVSVFSTHTPSDAVQEVRRKAKPGYEPVLEKATREAHEYWSSPQQLPHIRSGAEKVIELARQEARAQDAAKKTRI
ncbi:hypothetical protein HY994_02045 [Candidatus Micrarchaeota archaeon]|nr:hypothetical protein [Candidatus Micrarchaeota archaeon]